MFFEVFKFNLVFFEVFNFFLLFWKMGLNQKPMGLNPEPVSVWVEPKKPKNCPKQPRNPRNRTDQIPILLGFENQKPTIYGLGWVWLQNRHKATHAQPYSKALR